MAAGTPHAGASAGAARKGNADWIALTREEALELELPICDAHHHLWVTRDHPAAPRYLLEDFLADLDASSTGARHNIVSTVFIDSEAAYRADGPKEMRPVGEIEFANGMAAQSASGAHGPIRVAKGIIGHADMTLGEKAGAVLDAMMAAAPERFRGIRHCTTFDTDPHLPKHRDAPRAGMMTEPDFIKGAAELEKRDLIFESWCWHTQLEELAALARALPGLTVIANHCGGPLGIGPYAEAPAEVEALWRKGMRSLAACENVVMKLGGLNMVINGHGWEKRDRPPTSDEMVAAAGDRLRFAIELFGPERGMFESNFPAERRGVGYGPLWNFFKKVTRDLGAGEKAKLYHDNAVRIYRLG